MIICAVACYAAATGMVLFLPSLSAADGTPASLLQLLQAGQGGWLWPGGLLVVLAAAGIVLAALKTKASVSASAATACAGAAASIVSLLTSGITAQNIGDRIVALLLPLAFIWAAVCCGMLLYTRKAGKGTKESE